MSCVQPSLCLSHTEQPPRQQPVWFQKWTFNRDCLALSCWSSKTSKSRLTTRSSCQPYWERASQEPHSSGILERWGVQVATSNYWSASGLSSWTTFLICLYSITKFCHSETWLFIALLYWCHSTLPLISSWWSDNSCSNLSLCNIHFLLDEGPSPSTQPCQDRTACGYPYHMLLVIHTIP